MPNWNTRLAVSYTPENASTPVIITPIQSYTPTFAINSTVLHSIEQTHVGMVFAPENLTFTMTVDACSPAVAELTALAMQGQHFDITLQEQTGEDWAFASVVMSDCLITSAQPTAATVSGMPSATFSGVSLGASMEGKGELGSFSLPGALPEAAP